MGAPLTKMMESEDNGETWREIPFRYLLGCDQYEPADPVGRKSQVRVEQYFPDQDLTTWKMIKL